MDPNQNQNQNTDTQNINPDPNQPVVSPNMAQPVDSVTPVAPVAPQPVATIPAPATQSQPTLPAQPTVGQIATPPPQPGLSQAPISTVPPVQPVSQVGTGGLPMEPVKTNKSSKLIVVIVSIIVALAILAAAGWYGYSKFFAGLSLKTYNGDGYSLLVPKNYDQKDAGTGQMEFTEPGGDQDKENLVVVIKQKVPGDTDGDKILELFDTNLKNGLKSGAFDNDGSIDNLNFTKSTRDGANARDFTGTVKSSDGSSGTIRGFSAYKNNELYVVMAGTPDGEAAFTSSINKILDSFKVD